MRPAGKARRAKSGVPTVRVVHGGVQYREYLNEEQRSQPGCSAGRMQLEFHHGLLGFCAQGAGVMSASFEVSPLGEKLLKQRF